MEKGTRNELARRVLESRKRLHMTQSVMGQMIGISEADLDMVESGMVDIGKEMMLTMCLHFNLWDLLAESEFIEAWDTVRSGRAIGMDYANGLMNSALQGAKRSLKILGITTATQVSEQVSMLDVLDCGGSVEVCMLRPGSVKGWRHDAHLFSLEHLLDIEEDYPMAMEKLREVDELRLGGNLSVRQYDHPPVAEVIICDEHLALFNPLTSETDSWERAGLGLTKALMRTTACRRDCPDFHEYNGVFREVWESSSALSLKAAM